MARGMDTLCRKLQYKLEGSRRGVILHKSLVHRQWALGVFDAAVLLTSVLSSLNVVQREPKEKKNERVSNWVRRDGTRWAYLGIVWTDVEKGMWRLICRLKV